MTHKEARAKVRVYQWFIGCVYEVINTTHPRKVADVDAVVAEILDDLLDEDTSGEIAEQQLRVLREGIKDMIGCYSIAVADSATEELGARSNFRDALTPNYTEVDL